LRFNDFLPEPGITLDQVHNLNIYDHFVTSAQKNREPLGKPPFYQTTIDMQRIPPMLNIEKPTSPVFAGLAFHCLPQQIYVFAILQFPDLKTLPLVYVKSNRQNLVPI